MSDYLDLARCFAVAVIGGGVAAIVILLSEWVGEDKKP